MRISDWSSDVCSSDLVVQPDVDRAVGPDLRVDLHQPGQLLKQPVAVVLKPRVLRGAVGRAAQAGIEAGKRTADLVDPRDRLVDVLRSEEHTSELQSLMRISYAVFCLKKNTSKHAYNTIARAEHIYVALHYIHK